MHSLVPSLSLLLLLPGSGWALSDSNGISARDRIEEMEHIIVDNGGTNADGFVAAITPCSTYLGFASDATDRGEQSSAQWVRMIFHDFVTANIEEGTGYVVLRC
jgi:hypothetical protein